jgi:hypothetical protein
VTLGIDVARPLKAPRYGKSNTDLFALPGARIHLNIAQRL